MTIRSSIKNHGLLGLAVFSPSCNRLLNVLCRTLFATLLISLIGLPGLSSSALAVPEGRASQLADASIAQGDRMSALIDCLPKQLSQPSLKRAWSEMGNDQLERAFQLKANPKLSQAETELASCLNRKGFTP
jgi:hypothetical protein